MKMNESEKDIAKLKAENDALKDRLTKLENQIDPPPRPRSNYAPHDYTQGFSMPRSAMQAMIDAVPNSLMSELRADARKQNPVTGGPNPHLQTKSNAVVAGKIVSHFLLQGSSTVTA